MLLTVPFTRTSGGACGSTAMYFAASFAVMFCRHTVAHEKKKRRSDSGGKFSGAESSSVVPTRAGSAPPSARIISHARYASLNPPKSAMFSPWVSSPSTARQAHSLVATRFVMENGPLFRSSHASSCWWTTVAAACSTMTRDRFVNSAASSGAHQSFMFPSASYFLPWSSNPCVISWPMTAPMPPKLIAGSTVASKNGGCKMAAGKTISLSIGW